MPTAEEKMQPLDTGHYQRRRARELEDSAFEAEYRRARAEIAQVDAIMRQLDALREASGISKAKLARLIGRNPSTVRRLFTAEVNPELKTIAAIASVLGARLEITSEEPRERSLESAVPRSVA
ncbi:MAG: helix-turn-helix transcriptional regulator [Acidimicrobiales bacterium]